MSGRKTVLILGAGVMQLPAIHIAKEKGWKVVVMDGNPEAAGRAEADAFETIDLKDREGLLRKAAEYKSRGDLDGVFTAGTDFSAAVAYIAENLGLPGIPYEAALNATDKARMREVLTKAGVPCPKFVSVEKRDLPGLGGREWTFPLVVKPADNMGSRGVTRVDDFESLAATVEKALAYSRTGRVVVEEFIDGKEYSLDALVHEGVVTICGIADRHIYFPPAFVELGHTMPSNDEPGRLAEIAAVFEKGIRALGITNGAAKGDVFYSRRGPMIGEIAARLSGGYMSGWTYPYASGVRATEGALNIALGLPPGDLSPRFDRTAAERAFISIPGIVEEARGFDEAGRIEGVKDLFSRIETGGRVKFPENNVEKCGNVIAVHEARESAVSAAETAVSKIFLRLRPREKATAAFLFGKGRIPHWAYGSNDALDHLLGPVPLFETMKRDDDIVFKGIRVRRLSSLDTNEKDWNRKSIAAGLEEVRDCLYRSETPRGLGDVVLARCFWEAFLRGGSQGGLWVVDSLADTKGLKEAEETVKEWRDTSCDA